MNNNHYRNLINYIDELISYKSYIVDGEYSLSIEKLDEDELGKLAALFLEVNGRDAQDCFQDPNQYTKDDDITCALLSLLKGNTEDNRENLATMIFKWSIEAFKPSMQSLIDERCSEVREIEAEGHGFYKYRDQKTNELQWRKYA